jgi:hypothetical protein
MSGSRIFAGSGSGPTLTAPPPPGEPFALEPLFDAVDLVMTYGTSPSIGLRRAAGKLDARLASRAWITRFLLRELTGVTPLAVRRKSPRVELGRPILTQLVTRLFNAKEAGILLDLQELVEQTLVVRVLSHYHVPVMQGPTRASCTTSSCACRWPTATQTERGSSLPAEPTPKIPAKLRASREFDGSIARPRPSAPAPTPVPEPSQEAAPEPAPGKPEPVVFEQPQDSSPASPLSPSSLVTQISSDMLEEIENQVLDDRDKLASITFDAWTMSDEDLIKRCCLMATRLNLAEKLNVDQEVIVRYFRACHSQMHADAPFHNWHHVADVTQCLYTLLTQTGLAGKLSTEQLIAVFLAAPAHDLDHRGRSNVYEINENSEIAQAFPGEKGPLECHHSRLALKTLDSTGILKGLPKGSAELVRVCLRNALLATDMGRHGALMNRFNAVTAEVEMEITLESTNAQLSDFFKPGDKGWLLLGMLLKASDVSNPSRPIRIADKWNDLVYEEFYSEGDVDKERGRPHNPLHDRENNIISKSSVGFIGFVVLPIFQSLENFLATVTTEAEQGDDYSSLSAKGVKPFCEGLILNKNVSQPASSSGSCQAAMHA